jgi:hypothetical protein
MGFWESIGSARKIPGDIPRAALVQSITVLSWLNASDIRWKFLFVSFVDGWLEMNSFQVLGRMNMMVMSDIIEIVYFTLFGFELRIDLSKM